MNLELLQEDYRTFYAAGFIDGEPVGELAFDGSIEDLNKVLAMRFAIIGAAVCSLYEMARQERKPTCSAN